MRLYLASTSPARLATLRAAGLEPAGLINPGVDEDAVVQALTAAAGAPLSPHDMVLELARAKAEAVIGAMVDGEPIDGFILGGDSAFEFDGTVYGKPHEPAVARERWLAMRGGSGVLHSGHWIIDHRQETIARSGGSTIAAGIGCAGAGVVDSAEVHFSSRITDDDIDAYIATGEPLSVAGAFTIDSRGAAFIDRVVGVPSAVIGLSVPAVRTLLLDAFGAHWHEFWNR